MKIDSEELMAWVKQELKITKGAEYRSEHWWHEKSLRIFKRKIAELEQKQSNIWQPIETAPKVTGEEILLLFENKKVSVGYWDGYYAPGGQGYQTNFGDNGSWVEPISGEVLCLHYDPPTHWMPLPASPNNPTA